MDTLEPKQEINEYKPKRDLELFCYALISPDVKGNKDKAEQISGVDKGKFYWAWKNHQEFREWFSKLCFSILRTNEAIPPYALLGAIIEKDVQAIRTYYELLGKLKSPKTSVNLGVNIENKVNIGNFTGADKQFSDAVMERLSRKFKE